MQRPRRKILLNIAAGLVIGTGAGYVMWEYDFGGKVEKEEIEELKRENEILKVEKEEEAKKE